MNQGTGDTGTVYKLRAEQPDGPSPEETLYQTWETF